MQIERLLCASHCAKCFHALSLLIFILTQSGRCPFQFHFAKEKSDAQNTQGQHELKVAELELNPRSIRHQSPGSDKSVWFIRSLFLTFILEPRPTLATQRLTSHLSWLSKLKQSSNYFGQTPFSLLVNSKKESVLQKFPDIPSTLPFVQWQHRPTSLHIVLIKNIIGLLYLIKLYT